MPCSIILTRAVNSVVLVAFATILLFYLGPLADVISTPLPVLWALCGTIGLKVTATALVAIRLS